MLKRDLLPKLVYFASKLPVVALLGPRQSGKTTLAKAAFPHHRYISFEDIDQRTFATEDPRRFLRENSNDFGIILDEVQHVPTLLSYIQTYVDTHDKDGYFIITGSQNLLVNQAVTQTLAGRIAILTLLPFAIHELEENKIKLLSAGNAIFKGGYPRIYSKDLLPNEWYPFYIQTYAERDVRQILNVTDLSLFQKFMRLCAGRIGQLLNLSSLANDCGISVHTAKAWLSVLEASYLIFLLQPHYNNFSKRLIKSPKLYFYDTGVACSLLGIRSEEELTAHYLRGGLFESLVISELMKSFYNRGETPPLYFWRDSHGNEVDCIIEQGQKLIPIEIKAGETINSDYFSGLEYWQNLTQVPAEESFVVYAGNSNQARSKGNVISWRSIEQNILTGKK